METLFIHATPFNGIFLKDASGFTLGSFPTIIAAQEWCVENGYHSRIVD